jgi:DNA repair exonuclease SbcCD ATPase subunit
MITFHTVRWKNLLSTGNVYTEIQLDQHQNTLIVGENGAGKSTILDALTFALFGKPFRNINKPLLVNSINGKECVVEVEFTTGSKKYLVRRGIKPAVFEVYTWDFNGVQWNLLNQDARAADYQDMLSRFILKMNYKSFTQIVLLGTASFVPFMQLKAADRREVIEDLLDIQIFSNMNTVVKDRLSVIKGQMQEYKIRLESVKEKIDLHKKHLEELKRNNEEMIASKREQIENSKHQIIELEITGKELQAKVSSLLEKISDETTHRSRHQKLVTIGTKIDTNKKKIEKEVEFYRGNNSCPTCRQNIDPLHKFTVMSECEHKISELETALTMLQEEQNAVIKRLTEISQINGEISQLGRDIANNSSAISHTRKYITLLEQEIGRLTEQHNGGSESRDQSVELFEELTGYIEKRKKATEEKQYLDVAAHLLKDGGIKTRIIKQYLPIINKLVNKYLAAMDFFVNFTIDEEFNEVIKSRHRDDFSYENFSEGEKQKIDLALLLTWRSVARMKNSVNTNLLILDETFDSSLDSKGTDALLEILHQMPDNTNIFVISHKDQLHDKFNQSIRFEKKQNFSRIMT